MATASSGIDAIQHSRERDRLAQVVDAAEPRHDALDPHAEAGVRERAEAAQVEVPAERLLGQAVLVDALQQQLAVREALSPADDLAVALGREDVGRQAVLG